jgi:hypothetical protein
LARSLLLPEEWGTLVGPLEGTGDMIEVIDPDSLPEQAFYRVVRLQ